MLQIAARRRHNSRRNSSRRSFSSVSSGLSQAPSRTPCPGDTETFTYDPANLRTWHIPTELSSVLPPNLGKLLAVFQSAGAAVLTGFDRLADMSDSLPNLAEELPEPVRGEGDQSLADEKVAAKRSDYQPQSSREYKKDDEVYHCAPYRRDSANSFRGLNFNNSRRSSSFTGSNSAISSGTVTGSNSTFHPSPSSLQLLNLDATTTPPTVPPMSLNGRDTGDQTCPTSAVSIGSFASPRFTTATFAHHYDPRTAQYIAELHHLRREMLVHLRHAVRHVDAEWRECQRAKVCAGCGDGIQDGGVLRPAGLDAKFEAWWKEKKELVLELEHKARTIGRGVRASVGWSGDAGLGWVA